MKDAAKGPAVWRVKMAPLYLKRDGLPTTRPHWLVVAQNVLDEAEVKYFVSNAPAGTPPEAILHVAFGRWLVERCFQDQKTGLGMDHFEVRSYRAVIRHLTITAVAFLFLSRVRREKAGENPDLTVCQVRAAADATLVVDVGSLMGGVVGATEQNTRQALKVVDAMALCVCFLDEVEKALAGRRRGAATRACRPGCTAAS